MKEEIFQVWTRRIMVARRMYGFLVDRFRWFQLFCFDIPGVSLPIAILTMTIIQMQTNESRVTFVITAFSGISTILSMLSKVINLEKKINLCRQIKTDYDRLSMEIELMDSFTSISEDQIKNIESKLETIIHKDEDIVPEWVLEKFMGHQRQILEKYYNTPEREIAGEEKDDNPLVALRKKEDVRIDLENLKSLEDLQRSDPA